MENIKTSGATNIELECDGAYIARQGELITSPASKRISGISGTVLKYGAGVLRGAQISAVVDNADIDLYDGLSSGGTLIWASGNLKAKTDGTTQQIEFWGLQFNDGLFVNITDSAADILVVYE